MAVAKDKVTGLTPRQEAFCVALVKSEDGNASAAYRATFNCMDSSPRMVRNQAFRLSKNPAVAARIDELRAVARRKHEQTAERVLEEARYLAYFDPLAILDAEGNFRPLEEIPEATRRAILSIRFSGGKICDVKFCDKGQAVERLMRFHGLTGKDNGQYRNPFDALPPELKKEIEEYLIELGRLEESQQAAAGTAGKSIQ